MRFIALTRVEENAQVERTILVQPSKIVRLLRINPDGAPNERSYTHLGYGWSYGNNVEICEHVKETTEEIVRRIRDAGKSNPDKHTL